MERREGKNRTWVIKAGTWSIPLAYYVSKE
jgi:hypothetical protein